MKKNRMLALLLVAALAVSMLPMAAFAAEPWNAYVDQIGYESRNNVLGDWDKTTGLGLWYIPELTGTSATVNRKDFEQIMTGSNGDLYDLVGMHAMTGKTWENIAHEPVANGKTSVTVKAAPHPDNYATLEEYEAAYAKWAENNTDYVILAYAPHVHVYDGWQISYTNHWRYCYKCHANFLEMNWHHDFNNDDICDECGIEIVYYDITVAEATGGKITMEGDKDSTAAYNDKVTVTVEADEGYKVQDVRFYKVREDGSKAQIQRDIKMPGKTYAFTMPNFDAEIVVTFAEK